MQLEQKADGDALFEAAERQLQATLQEFIAARSREGGKLAQVMRPSKTFNDALAKVAA